MRQFLNLLQLDKSWINCSDKIKIINGLKYEDILLSKKIFRKILIFDYNLDDKIIDKILYEEKSHR